MRGNGNLGEGQVFWIWDFFGAKSGNGRFNLETGGINFCEYGLPVQWIDLQVGAGGYFMIFTQYPVIDSKT